MGLPIRTTVDDVNDVCGLLARKPTGSSVTEMKKILDAKRVDGRKLSALKFWGLIEESEVGKYRVTPGGREVGSGDQQKREAALTRAIRRAPPYAAIIERIHHRREASISATDVAAHWHEHFPAEAASTDKVLNDQALCFFQLAQGASLGQMVLGRKGAPTRFEFDSDAIARFVDGQAPPEAYDDAPPEATNANGTSTRAAGSLASAPLIPPHGQGIFIAHGKNKKPLEQLERILGQFKVPYKVAAEEPHLGRPISSKVRETMHLCNCAILIFTADEKFIDKDSNEIWRPSENVVYELGACGYLYGDRVVIIKEDKVLFPSNFRDIGYISFSDGGLDAKAMDIIKELIGFGIVKITT